MRAIEGNIMREETDTLCCVCVNEGTNTAAQNGADEDIRVVNDHFIGLRPCRADATA
jgi:hypothetical protein